ncbi:MAG: GLPGLI family protein [Leeuwenhoekiella sp.]
MKYRVRNNDSLVIQENRLKQTDVFGETLNVILPEEGYNWSITAESKDILGYSCLKATAKDSILDNSLQKTEISISAWFAPELNSIAGPQGLDNLPGLVLEGSIDKKYTFYASQINLNPSNLTQIRKPKGGRDISEKDFNEMVRKILKDILARG